MAKHEAAPKHAAVSRNKVKYGHEAVARHISPEANKEKVQHVRKLEAEPELKPDNMRPKKSSGKIILRLSICVLLVLAVCIAAYSIHRTGSGSVYSQITEDGYTGTQEQLLVSLVGEDIKTEGAPTAYELAAESGYTGSFDKWMKTLTGHTSSDEKMSAFRLMQEKGYKKSIGDWLSDIAVNEKKLGKSGNDSEPTDYEMACQFGYTGTFIEWIVSISHDKVF